MIRQTVPCTRVALAIVAALGAPGCALLAPAASSNKRESAATAGRAKVDFTVAAVSDYVFRGVSLSDGRLSTRHSTAMRGRGLLV